MDLGKYHSLQKKFENKRFEKTHYWTNKTLYYGSFLGNLLSIILAFFFVNKISKETAVHFAGQDWILPIFVVLFLTIFEFAKRFTFANTVVSYLTTKKLTLTFFLSLIFSLSLVGLTFYLSLSGANHYANKSEVIEINTQQSINKVNDSLTNYYVVENKKLEDRIDYLYTAAAQRKKKSLTESEVQQVQGWEVLIEKNKQVLENKIKEANQVSLLSAEKEKEKSSKNQIAFILISAFIELLILIGVGFSQYYAFVSFKEKKEGLVNNANYHKLINYLDLLRVLYNNGKTTTGAILPSFNQFKDLANASGKKYQYKTLKEFITLTSHLKIIQTVGKNKTVIVSYEQAQEIINNYLTIED